MIKVAKNSLSSAKAFSRFVLLKATRAIIFVYKNTHQLRRTLLLSVFGYVSECKHNPTCSEYLLFQVEKNGWRGFKKGIARLLKCF